MIAAKSFTEIYLGACQAAKVAILCSVVSLAACQGDNLSAPYDFSGVGNQNLSEAPVTTDLHTYDRDFRSEDRFRRFGPPLKLTFPKKFYGLLDNVFGGPQHIVVLKLDGPTLRSEVDVVRERYTGETWEEKARVAFGGGAIPNYQLGQYHDGMSVSIDNREIYTGWSNRRTLVRNIARSVAEDFIKEAPKTRARYVGQYCGFDIYDQVMWREEDNRPATRGAALDRLMKGKGSFTGLNLDKGASLLAIGCSDKPSQCTAYISYREFGLSATVDRSRICQFMPSIRALPQFLDQHAAYPLPQTTWAAPLPSPRSMGGPLINAAPD